MFGRLFAQSIVFSCDIFQQLSMNVRIFLHGIFLETIVEEVMLIFTRRHLLEPIHIELPDKRAVVAVFKILWEHFFSQ